jgi:hypothetical protein
VGREIFDRFGKWVFAGKTTLAGLFLRKGGNCRFLDWRLQGPLTGGTGTSNIFNLTLLPDPQVTQPP